jgi:hypothetical protein
VIAIITGFTRSTVPSARRYSLQASLASTTSTSVDRGIDATDKTLTPGVDFPADKPSNVRSAVFMKT